MFNKQTVKDIDISNKSVLLRADYNVPINNGQITDDYRLQQSIETIKYLLEHNCKITICSHLGRPEGQIKPEFSLKPVSIRLSELLNQPVEFIEDCISDESINKSNSLQNKQILLLENLRFHPEEEANDQGFAEKLAHHGELFVQDGFGVVHRAHASTEAITRCMPSVAGLLLEKEVTTITSAMVNPKRPLLTIIGGAKVKDKIEILKQFIKIADVLVIGGAIANPFIAAQGVDIKASFIEDDEIDTAKEIMALAEEESKLRQFNMYLPHDSVVATAAEKNSQTRIVDFTSNTFADIMAYPRPVDNAATKLSDDEKILDIGPFSASYFAGIIQLANTVIWNGTMGITETESLQGPIGPFSHGTYTLVEAITGDFGHKPLSVVGGGDTVGYIESNKLINRFNHVSTGGGASLDLMSGHKLPGVEALQDKSGVQ